MDLDSDAVDLYMATLEGDAHTIAQHVRRVIHHALPGITETVRYKMPCFSFDGAYLVYLGAWKKHIGLYPIPVFDGELEQDVAPYRAAKDTVRFPYNREIPYDLIERLIVALAVGDDVTPSLAAAVRSALASAGDPGRAAQQQAYMKSTMPYRGVSMPEVRRIAKAAVKEHPLRDQSHLIATVNGLWDNAQYREERYAALAILHGPKHRPWRDLTLLPLYEHLVITGRWWDLVDDLATHAIGELLRAYPAEVAPVMLTWASDHDLWRRRAALVCQVGAKSETDADLLGAIITAAVDERDFFVRKGIGWALRDYARTDPDWVGTFVAEHADELSPLSIREATKHLDRPSPTDQ